MKRTLSHVKESLPLKVIYVACVILLVLGVVSGCKIEKRVYFQEFSRATTNLTISSVSFGYRGDELRFVVFKVGQMSSNSPFRLSWHTLASGTNVCSESVLYKRDGSTVDLKFSGRVYEYSEGKPLIEQAITFSRTTLETYIWSKIRNDEGDFSFESLTNFLSQDMLKGR